MKKKTKITSVVLIILLAGLTVYPAFCRSKKKHFGLNFVHKAEKQSQADHLVVITHGWIHKGKGRWPEKMAKAINENVDSEQWMVGYFDWGKGSATINPVDAVTYARDIAGAALAGQILKVEGDYKHIHLIGHSSGAWVISEAAKILSDQIKTDIHLTFLDAYVPKDWRQEQLGDINCPADVNYWAEHYWTADITQKVTGIDLTHAHNVSLTRIDQYLKDHNFPWKWYYATVTGEFPKYSFLDNKKLVTDANGIKYGFARSLEKGSGKWQESLKLKVGNKAVELEKKP